MTSVSRLDTLGTTRQQLDDAGYIVFAPESEDLPMLMAADQQLGLVAIDLRPRADGAIVDLNRKIARLRSDLPELERVPVQRVVIAEDASISDGQLVTIADAESGAFIGTLPAGPLPEDALSALRSFLAPRISIVVPRRLPMTDEDSASRAEQRLVLDAAQTHIATRLVDDVMLITGPPGSGKTLVLAARAKWMAAKHPNWRIVLLCYNRLFVPYLQELVWGHSNIDVHTFGQFTSRLRVRVSLDNEEWAAKNVAVALGSVKPTFDALLIDEWQDFMDPWTKLALATVKPNRGGLTLAGDPKQALYRDSDPEAALAGRRVDTVTLTRPYRSTRQILEVTSALDESMDVTGRGDAYEGRPVDLVWAENVGEIGAAIGRDIQLLIEQDERRPQEIGVLVTRKWDIPKVVYAIKSAAVPVAPVYSNQVDQFDLTQPTVKVMTVHSAKGYEFDVVFLVGMEHIANPDGSERADREGRCGFVGFTRAKDQLVLTYSRENVYLDRIRALPGDLVQQWIWPDDYPGTD